MGSVVKRVTRPFKKIAKKIIPKEIRPALPYIAAFYGGPAMAGSSFMSGIGNAALRSAISKGLVAGATAGLTDDDANILRTATLAAAPDLISGGLGNIAGRIDPNIANTMAGVDVDAATQLADTGKLAAKTARVLSNVGQNIEGASALKTIGAQTSIDAAAKFAELNQAEIDKYNASLLSSGMNSKSDRRNAIYQIYMNTGAYEADEVNSMLDKYGYASGGSVGFANGGSGRKTRGTPMYTASMKKFFGIKDTDDEEEVKEKIKIKVGDTKEVKGEEERPIQITFSGEEEPNYSNLTNQALSGVETAFGRSFGEMEPVPMLRFAQGGDVGEYKDIPNIFNHSDDGGIMNKISESMERDYDYFTRIKMRENLKQGETMEDAADLSEQEAMDMVMNKYTKGGFARGGEVEIEEETEDLGIRDLMRDQGVEYGEQVSNAQNDELLEKLFEEFIDLGFSPEDAARKAREAFDDMSQGQGIEGTQVASGYRDPMLVEMYQQYVFEQEELGVRPMSFEDYKDQATSGMASGGRVNYAGGGTMNTNLLNTGMDKDMRGGGFIPEGTKEKADDVPARLSKNEFVMTADAVKAAGGGSVNKGAQKMYNMMHQLEAKV